MVSSPLQIKVGGDQAGDALGSDCPDTGLPWGLGWEPLALSQAALFGTDGIRGPAGKLLSAPLALQIGFWAGQVLRSQTSNAGPVILGQDSRNSSDMLSAALSAGLTAAGLEVWNLGLCPTAGVAHLTHSTEALGGIMISASHNPPGDNGIKFFGANGTKLSTALQADIEAGLRGKADRLASKGWGRQFYRPDLVGRYSDALQTSLGDRANLRGLRIVLDLTWGAAAHVAPAVFKAMGAEVICLHELPDGDRINVECGSTHLAPLKAAVKAHQANLGFAFDGDADRVMAIDAQGRVVNGDHILYLWGCSLRASQQLPEDTIVSTVMANLGFERAWEAQGGKLVRTAVGDQHVHAEMVRRGATLGGEQSGHILCSHYGVSGDGILAALHLAELAQQAKGCLTTLVDESFNTYPQMLKNVRVEDRERRLNWQDCNPLQRDIARAEAAMAQQGRVLVRASGTEPVIRVMVEAADSTLVTYWTDRLANSVVQNLAA